MSGTPVVDPKLQSWRESLNFLGSLKRLLRILIYGDTGDGKTALVGELAEALFVVTGKKTLLFSADRGGWETIQPYVDLGVIDVIAPEGDIWVWTDHSAKGERLVGTKWTPIDWTKYALAVYESATSIADALMADMAIKASEGVNIGGGGAYSFVVGQGLYTSKIGSNNQTHYNVAQQQILSAMGHSQRLPVHLLWSASARRSQDDLTNLPVLGPQVIGKALTAEIPRWFVHCFRVMAEPQLAGVPKHALYIEDHKDPTAAGAKGLGNGRVPLRGEDAVKIPFKIEPASIVEALRVLTARQQAAVTDIKARLGL